MRAPQAETWAPNPAPHREGGSLGGVGWGLRGGRRETRVELLAGGGPSPLSGLSAGPDGLFLFLSLAPSSVLADPKSHVVITHEDRLITEGTCVIMGVSSGES